MKRFGWLVILALLLPSAAVAEFRDMKGRWALGVDLGANVPTGDLGNILKTGLMAELTGEYYVSNPVSLGASIQGIFNSITDSSDRDDPSLNAKIYSFNLYGRFAYVLNSLAPYLIIGGGGYNREVEFFDPLTMGGSTSTVTDQSTRPGAFGGLGVVFPVSRKVDVLAEGTFTNIFLEDDVARTFDNHNFVNLKGGIRVVLGGD